MRERRQLVDFLPITLVQQNESAADEVAKWRMMPVLLHVPADRRKLVVPMSLLKKILES
jgi:hypothetical protein